MKISRADCNVLVFNIFRFYERTRSGERLRIGDLDDRWQYSGLRRTDLAEALDSLVASGRLTCVLTPVGMVYALTDSGARYLAERPESPAVRRALYQLSRRERTHQKLVVERRQQYAFAH